MVRSIERENLGFFLGFVEPISQVSDDFDRCIGVSLEHFEIGMFSHSEYADVAHRLGRARMAGTIKCCCITTEEISRHQHLKGAFLSIGRGFNAFHRAFFHNVKVFSRVPFAENDVASSVAGFKQFAQHALTILCVEDIEERNAGEQIVCRPIRLLIPRFVWPFRQWTVLRSQSGRPIRPVSRYAGWREPRVYGL